MPVNRSTGVKSRFAYIHFQTVEDANKAKEGMNGDMLDGCRIRVKFAASRPMGHGMAGRRPKTDVYFGLMKRRDARSRSVSVSVKRRKIGR